MRRAKKILPRGLLVRNSCSVVIKAQPTHFLAQRGLICIAAIVMLLSERLWGSGSLWFSKAAGSDRFGWRSALGPSPERLHSGWSDYRAAAPLRDKAAERSGQRGERRSRRAARVCVCTEATQPRGSRPVLHPT